MLQIAREILLVAGELIQIRQARVRRHVERRDEHHAIQRLGRSFRVAFGLCALISILRHSSPLGAWNPNKRR